MHKRLIVCCDGTWNTPDQQAPTNVTKLALAVAEAGADGMEQRVYYHRGVGTSRWQRLRGGAFGMGLSRNVRDCYRFLIQNYAPGDQLFLLGFSRGAFTARSLAGLVRNSGLLRPEHIDRVGQAYALYRDRGTATHPRGIEATLFRRTYSYESGIRFIGVWDTVGALGIPITFMGLLNPINRRYRFHDTALSTTVQRAHQALAIDERRGPFAPTMWVQQPDAVGQILEQVWFAGVHTDVGGGQRDPGLADIALLWMVDRAADAGVAFDPGYFSAAAPADAAQREAARRTGAYVAPDPALLPHDSFTGLYRLLPAHVRRPGREQGTDGAGAKATGSRQSVASSARDLLNDGRGYAPAALVEFLDAGGPVTAV